MLRGLDQALAQILLPTRIQRATAASAIFWIASHSVRRADNVSSISKKASGEFLNAAVGDLDFDHARGGLRRRLRRGLGCIFAPRARGLPLGRRRGAGLDPDTGRRLRQDGGLTATLLRPIRQRRCNL